MKYGGRWTGIALIAVLLVTAGAVAEDVVYVVNSYVHGTSPRYSTLMMVRNNTFAILKTLELAGDAAHTVAVRPDKQQLWVTSPPENVVYVIGAHPFEVQRTIYYGDTVLHRPMGAGFAPDGSFIYVTLEGSGDLDVWNTTADVPVWVGRIDVGGMPNSVAFDPAGTRAYVMDYQNTTVTVIRTSDHTVVTTLDFEGHALQDGVVSPDGSRLYVSNMGMNRIEVVRTSDNTILAPIVTAQIKPRAIGISPDGGYLFVGHYLGIDAVVNMMRLSDQTVVASAAIPSNPRCMAVKDNGRRIVVTEHNYDQLYAYSVDTTTETLTLTAIADLNTIPGYSASPVGVAFGEHPHPEPIVRINGLETAITLSQSDNLNLSLHMTSNGLRDDADWFLVGWAPFGTFFWDPHSGWSGIERPAYQGALVDVPSFASPPVSLAAFPTGRYYFGFGVDLQMNGSVDLPYTYAGFITLDIVP